ncbi:MAG TPA: DUF4932 domain-containing protein [Bacteroidales bacterium]|nr:DUF4932 domain-containing protein [Bacteroidales bacterium]
MKEKVLLPIVFVILFIPFLHSQETAFRILLDPRIELLSVIQSLSDWPEYGAFTKFDSRYRNEVNLYFQAYKDHDAVRWFNENLKLGWSFDAPPKAMMHLSYPPQMKIAIPFTEELFERGGGEKNLLLMVQLLNQFIEDTGFEEFFASQQGFYTEFIDRINNQIPFTAYTKLMQDFYGGQISDFVFIPVPLFLGGYGYQLEREEGKTAFYFGGPHSIDQGLPVFEPKLLRILIFHEFGHSFVNPVVYDFEQELNAYSSLFEYMKKDMRRQAYGEWTTVCHEHLVRTGEIFLNKLAGFPEEAEEIYNSYYESRKFLFLPFFREKMDYYCSHRDEYPSFRSYFPELLKVFEEVEPVADKIVAGGMNFIMDINSDSCIIKRFDNNSPLEKAGCKPGDRINKINEIKFDGNNYFKIIKMWDEAKVGQEFSLEVTRNGENLEMLVVVPPDTTYTFRKKQK